MELYAYQKIGKGYIWVLTHSVKICYKFKKVEHRITFTAIKKIFSIVSVVGH